MGTKEDRKETKVHNAASQIKYEHQILNDNVTEWLLGTVEIPDDEIFAKSRCALMYTLFEHDLTEPVEQRPRPEIFNSRRHFIGKSA